MPAEFFGPICSQDVRDMMMHRINPIQNPRVPYNDCYEKKQWTPNVIEPPRISTPKITGSYDNYYDTRATLLDPPKPVETVENQIYRYMKEQEEFNPWKK